MHKTMTTRNDCFLFLSFHNLHLHLFIINRCQSIIYFMPWTAQCGDRNAHYTDLSGSPTLSGFPVALVSVSEQLSGFCQHLESFAILSCGKISMTVANAKSGSGKPSKAKSSLAFCTEMLRCCVLNLTFNQHLNGILPMAQRWLCGCVSCRQ